MSRPVKRIRPGDMYIGTRLDLKPAGPIIAKEYDWRLDPNDYRNQPKVAREPPPPTRQQIAAVIAAASAAAATAAAEAAAVPSPAPEAAPAKKSRSPRKPQTQEEKDANKEKRLLKLVGSVVVKCMSKYQRQMDTTQFKKHAKEVRILRSLSARI